MCRVVVPKVQLREAKKKKKGPKMGARPCWLAGWLAVALVASWARCCL
jgi:hypothetical protein